MRQTNTDYAYDYAATSLMFKLPSLFEFQLRKWVGQRHRNSGPLRQASKSPPLGSTKPTRRLEQKEL